MSMIDIQAKIQRSDELLDEATAILTNKEASAEDKAKVEPLMEEGKSLRADALQLKEIMEAGAVVIDAQEELKKEIENQGPDKAKEERKSEVQFDSWDKVLEAIWYANHKDAAIRFIDPRLQYFNDKTDGLNKKEQKALSGGAGATGGFLIPTEFDANLRAAMAETSIIRPRASIIRMRRRSIEIPVLDQSNAVAGVPAWFGGMQFYWTGEGAEKTDTEPAFEQVVLSVNKLVGYTISSDELISDSAISLADFFSGPLGFAGGVSFMEDYYFFNGNGTGQPLGILDAAVGGRIDVPRATANEVGYEDLVAMLKHALPSAANLVWVINQSALDKMILLEGPTGNPSYVWGSAVTGAPDMLLGRPVIWSEKNATLGALGDVCLMDFSYYLVGDREATTIESTQYDRWKFDQTSWRVVHRVDGRPWLESPITLIDGVTEVSPFVALAPAA